MSSLQNSDEVIVSKSANALAEFGDLSMLAKASMILADEGASLLMFEALKKLYGGTWVGGTATLTKDRLSFTPSALNRLLPVKSASITIPLGKIANIVLEGGFITKVIRIEATDVVVRLRCYGAAEFTEKIRATAKPT